jgi:sugar phosphate isomerase/epimerase
MKPIALQLYTVRELCAQDFAGTLKHVADIGYKGVEFAGFYDTPPAEVKKMVDDLGLQVSSAHLPMPTKENVAELLDTCNTIGIPRIVSGFGPDQVKTVEGCNEAVAKLNAALEALEGSGVALAIHNHWWEFRRLPDGQLPEDILLNGAPGVGAQLDVYWVAVGGEDPAATVARLGKRAPLLHIKDGLIDPPQPMTPVGEGKLDMPAIIKAADPNVLEWLIVELDSCAIGMLEAAEKSYRYLVDNGLGEGNK